MPPITDQNVVAHGFVGLTDLPVPLGYVLIAATVVLTVSFAVLALAWRTPRFTGDESGVALPGWLAAFVESRVTRAMVVSLGLLFSAWVTMAAFFGKNTFTNPVFGSVYAVLWVGLVPAALVFGPVYRLCNPLRWIYRGICAVTPLDASKPLIAYPARLGLWPGALGLLAFTWLELVDPDYSTSLPYVRAWFLLVGVILLAAATLFGDDIFAHADPFEVFSSMVARLSPFGRRTDGALVVRNPLENLDGMVAPVGLVGVVSVLFGSTAFDGYHESIHWLRFAYRFDGHLVAVNTVALVAFCAIVLSTFCGASLLIGRLGELNQPHLPRLFAHSMVPIVVGYVVAHYLTFFISISMRTLQELGDPLSRGWNLTGFADGLQPFAIYGHPTAIAAIKVTAVVAGHVIAVVSAHDRAVALLPRRRALLGQVPMLVLMVAYTLTGLALLFSS